MVEEEPKVLADLADDGADVNIDFAAMGKKKKKKKKAKDGPKPQSEEQSK